MSTFAEVAFPPEILCEILIWSGAWSPVGEDEVDGAAPSNPGNNPHHVVQGRTAAAAATARPRICAWSVCRAWRDCLRGPPPDRLARLLLEEHGPDQALVRAVRCTSIAVDRCDLIRAVLGLPNVRADCMDGGALISAAEHGRMDAVRLLLTWREHAPKANCQDGRALGLAARFGLESVVQLLLESREHAPRADCHSGEALIMAAERGHEAVVRLLLGWREHAPRADCRNGAALI